MKKCIIKRIQRLDRNSVEPDEAAHLKLQFAQKVFKVYGYAFTLHLKKGLGDGRLSNLKEVALLKLYGSNFFPFSINSYSERRQTEKDRVASLNVYPFTLRFPGLTAECMLV